MCDALVWSFDVLTGVPWLEVIKALAPVATAFIAWRALANWRRQDKAKRHADFLDQLTDAVHSFVGLMPGPITTVRFVKTGMAYHIPMESKNEDPYVAAAIDYIESRGADESKRLIESLDPARPVFVRIQSLSAKGQVFGFEGYKDCKKAVAKLTWQFGRMQALAAFIGSSTWHWKNPDVVAHLTKLMELEPEDIQKHLDDNLEVVHAFVRDAYTRIYG